LLAFEFKLFIKRKDKSVVTFYKGKDKGLGVKENKKNDVSLVHSTFRKEERERQFFLG